MESNNNMYTRTNFKTKKALKEAVASGATIKVYQPNDMAGVTWHTPCDT